MIVALGGMCRNATGYLARYFDMAHALRHLLEVRCDRLRLVIAEGDSTDHTWVALAEQTRSWDAALVKRSHGGGPWGSEDNPARWRALSWVCNGVLDHVAADVDLFIYVEMDLVWTAETMIALLDQLSEDHPAVAPMCFAGEAFYDTWGHIKNGVQFAPFPPYHAGINGLTQVDSVGSCYTMLGSLARRVRYGPEDLVRGLGRSIYANGGSLWLDPTLRVTHP